MQSAVRAVLLQCRRRSRPGPEGDTVTMVEQLLNTEYCPSQNASTQRGCLPQRPDP
jgi:hypothetical protein